MRYLLVFICFILLLSCNKEEGGLTPYRKIEGKWFPTEIEYVLFGDTTYHVTQGAYLEFEYCETPPCSGKEYNQVHDSIVEFTYELKYEGTEISIIEVAEFGIDMTGTWEFDKFTTSEIIIKASLADQSVTTTLTKE